MCVCCVNKNVNHVNASTCVDVQECENVCVNFCVYVCLCVCVKLCVCLTVREDLKPHKSSLIQTPQTFTTMITLEITETAALFWFWCVSMCVC